MNRSYVWSGMTVAVFLAFAVRGSEALAQTRVTRTEVRPSATPMPAGGGVVRIRTLTGTGPRGLVRTPSYTTSISAGRAPARDWCEIMVQFDTEPEWMDELSFQYYALLYDRVKKEHTFLKGSVTHVDVARGKGHLSSAYIRPGTLTRYGEVVAVAAEALSKGVTVAAESEGRMGDRQPLPADWWKTIKLVPKDGYILNRTQTPFAFINYDDYEAIK